MADLFYIHQPVADTQKVVERSHSLHFSKRRVAHVVALNIGHLGVNVLHRRRNMDMAEDLLEVDHRAARCDELRSHGVAAAVETKTSGGNTTGQRHML